MVTFLATIFGNSAASILEVDVQQSINLMVMEELSSHGRNRRIKNNMQPHSDAYSLYSSLKANLKICGL